MDNLALVEKITSFEDRINSVYNKMLLISKQRELDLAASQKVASKLERLLDILPAAVIVVDEKGIICQHNTAASCMFSADLLNKSWSHIAENYFQMHKNDIYEMSLINGNKVNITTAPLNNGWGQIILISDITDIVNIMDKKNNLNRLTSLGSMLAKLAHQIKTPLSSAILYADNMFNSEIDIKQKNIFIKKMKDRLFDLNNLVDDMISYVKEGRVIKEKINIKDLLNELTDSLEQKLNGRNLVINNDNNTDYIFASKSSLKGSLVNIIMNAIDASKPNTKIILRVTTIENEIYFQVIDYGSGISKEILDKILNPFYTTKENGTGLGLAVAKSMAVSHGGSIDISSEDKTVITIKLPLQENIDCLVQS